jgi:type IV secretory pathway VirJ component
MGQTSSSSKTTATELAKMLMEHPDWEVEVEGYAWFGMNEPTKYTSSPEVDELPEQKKFLIYTV